MKTKSKTFLYENECEWKQVGGGMKRQIMGFDGQIMMVKAAFETGAVALLHEHYHSQVTYVAEGRFEIMVGSEKRVLEKGDGFYAEPDMPHKAICLEKGVLIDVFTPQRADFQAL